ncbi:MAG: Vancomycin B-type resistance protein VanW [Microgenomates group bacterium ADurb.Bin219]|nr:MAG: Vancomycin B-type resistance protein VanW [Microgenomates group bacterium ADurb.Bin219]HNP89132.1 VanW family protein [Candidatus Woesebacteria bacterium]
MVNKNPKKIFSFLPAVAVIFLGLPLIILVAYQLAYRNRTLPKTYLCEEDVSNKNRQDLHSKLAEMISFQKNFYRFLRFSYQNETWEINLEEINFRPNPNETSERIFRVGREANPLENLQTRIKIWQKGRILPFQYSLDNNLLEEKIATLSGRIYEPEIEPKINLVKDAGGNKSVEIEPGKDGLEVDREKLIKEINRSLGCFDPSFINLPVRKISSAISTAERTAVLKRAESLLDKSLKITFGNQAWQLNDQNLVDFLSFKTSVAEEKINQYLEELKKIIETDPQNATLQIENGKAVVFTPSQDGFLLDRKKTKEKFITAIDDLINQADLKQKEIEVVVTVVSPKITTESINNLGIKEIVGTGNSKFAGSIEQRIFNIGLATSKLNGVVIAPGEIFSFNEAVGDISEATGYKKAYIIQQGRTVLGDGGGVCQVSTTLFRAALDAGLPIKERHSHAYRVSYYEQDSGPGLDATVFSPTADLKFENDTANHLLIQGQFNKKAKTLSFKLYGTADGRKAEIGKPIIKDVSSPPPDLYQDDPTLALGTVKQIDWKAWGAKVNFHWRVTRGEEVLQDKTFYSNYQPWQAIFLRGTKTQ